MLSNKESAILKKANESVKKLIESLNGIQFKNGNFSVSFVELDAILKSTEIVMMDIEELSLIKDDRVKKSKENLEFMIANVVKQIEGLKGVQNAC